MGSAALVLVLGNICKGRGLVLFFSFFFFCKGVFLCRVCEGVVVGGGGGGYIHWEGLCIIDLKPFFVGPERKKNECGGEVYVKKKKYLSLGIE